MEVMMRIETEPYGGLRKYTYMDRKFVRKFGWGGKKMVHEPLPVQQKPLNRFFKCPKCGGKAKDELDGFDLLITCINCGNSIVVNKVV